MKKKTHFGNLVHVPILAFMFIEQLLVGRHRTPCDCDKFLCNEYIALH